MAPGMDEQTKVCPLPCLQGEYRDNDTKQPTAAYLHRAFFKRPFESTHLALCGFHTWWLDMVSKGLSLTWR